MVTAVDPLASVAAFAGDGDVGLDGVAFDSLMAPFAPFESRPHLAVAVSGGADSLCLCLLADVWARARGGRISALTVDHGLRAGSAAEARQVGDWLGVRGIEHHVLSWRGEKPSSGVQAAARDARYALMEGWCRQSGVLHLLLAHHADDQAETYLIRRAHGSGPDGLAGMAAESARGAMRVLRPLLSVEKTRLTATLGDCGQPWIEDPSNRNPAFERVRIRQARSAVPEAGMSTAELLARTERFGARRVVRDEDRSAELARRCRLDPAGFAELDVGGDVATSWVGRVLMTVGGRVYPVARDKVARVLAQDGGSVAGCAWRRDGTRLRVWRECRGLPAPVAVVPGARLRWDNRFQCRFSPALGDGLHMGALGHDGWAQIAALVAPDVRRRVFHNARASLPALWDGARVLAVPSMRFATDAGIADGVRMAFCPPVPLDGGGFARNRVFYGCATRK